MTDQDFVTNQYPTATARERKSGHAHGYKIYHKYLTSHIALSEWALTPERAWADAAAALRERMKGWRKTGRVWS